MIDIKTIGGEQLMSVPILQDAVIHEELMVSGYIALAWNSEEGDELPVGTFIEFEGERYSLYEPYTPTMVNEGEYRYNPRFYSREEAWNKQPACVYTYEDDGVTVKSREFDWSFVGSPADAMQIIKQAIKNEVGEDWTIVIADSLPSTIEISSQTSSIASILSDIASQCETEYWVDRENNALHLSKCERGESVILEVGSNVGVPAVSTKGNEYYTRYYALGSTRNITQTSGNISGSVNKRLTLDPAVFPMGYKDIKGHFEDGVFVSDLEQGEIFSKVVLFDDIYPSSDLEITDVRARMKYRLDGGKKVKIGGTDENPVYDQYAIWYFKIKDFTFSEDLLIEGLPLSVHFKSGRLTGQEFELIYHDKSKTENAEGDVIPFEVQAGDYEIKFKESSGTILPDIGYIIPQNTNKVTLFNIEMPSEYTESAQQRLLEALDKVIAKEHEDSNTYEVESNPVSFYESDTFVSLGQRVSFVNGGKSLETRVLMVERRLDSPSEQKIRVGNDLIQGSTKELRENVASLNHNVDVLAAFNDLSQSIQDSYGRTQALINESVAYALGIWYDEDGVLTTDKAVRIKNNLIVNGDTASGDEGEDTPAIGTVIGVSVDGVKYTDVTAGILDLSDAFNSVSIDLSDYYTKVQVDNKIAGLNVGQYATVTALNAVSDRVLTLENAGYATTGYVDTKIANLINGAPTTLDTLKEIADALAENEDVVDALEAAIGTKANASDLTALAARVTTNEGIIASLSSGKADKATTLAGYGITNAYTKTEVDSKVTTINTSITAVSNRVTTLESWKTDIAKYITIVDGNVKISTNLIVSGDTASGGDGEDTAAIGTVTGIKVNGTTYNPTAGIVTIPDYPTTLEWNAISGKPSFATVATSGSYDDLSNKPTIPSLAGYATETWVSQQIADIDFSNYYTIAEVDKKISDLNIGQYATISWVESQDYIPKSGGELKDNAALILRSYSTRTLTITGNSITADMSQDPGGWAGAFASVKDPTGTITTMLGWYGGKSGLTHIFMGGTYSDPAMKMTKAGDFVFRNVPTAGGYTLATSKDLMSKQDAISDLATIRSNASNGATAYGWGNHASAGYAKATDVPTLTAFDALRSEFDALESALNDDVSGKINTWNEIVDFLDEYSGSEDLATILAGINSDIANVNTIVEGHTSSIGSNASAIGVLQGYFTNGVAKKATADANGNVITSYYTPISTHNALATRVTTIETWKTDLSRYITIVDGNVKISTNLIVSGDTASGGDGEDTAAIGTVTGVEVNGVKYTDVSAGILDLSDAFNNVSVDLSDYYTKAQIDEKGFITSHQTIYALTIKNSAGTTQLTYTPNSGAGSLTLTKAMVGLANVDNTADANKSVKYATSAGSAPASDVYAWAKASTKPAYTTKEVTESGNLYFTNARAVAALTDTLASYATQSWVEGKKYITASAIPTLYVLTIKKADGTTLVAFDPEEEDKTITLGKADVGLGNVENKSSATIRGELTSANVTTALGYTPYNATNPNGYISGITSAMVTTALGYTPANNASLANYLPLSGGTLSNRLTISSGADQKLILNNTDADTNYSWIVWQQNGVDIGSLGLAIGGTDLIWNGRTLIRSNNIGDYAFIPRADNLIHNVNADDYITNAAYLNQTGNGSGSSNFPQTYSMFLTFTNGISTRVTQLSLGTSRAFYRTKIDNWSSWHEFITNNNIGSQSVKYATSAGSATKLATARTIWGQSFDGTGNVTGALSGVTNINGALYINSSGNVGIGTTAPAYKLDVAGTGRFTSTLTVGGGATITGNSTINGNLVVTGDVASA